LGFKAGLGCAEIGLFLTCHAEARDLGDAWAARLPVTNPLKAFRQWGWRRLALREPRAGARRQSPVRLRRRRPRAPAAAVIPKLTVRACPGSISDLAAAGRCAVCSGWGLGAIARPSRKVN